MWQVNSKQIYVTAETIGTSSARKRLFMRSWKTSGKTSTWRRTRSDASGFIILPTFPIVTHTLSFSYNPTLNLPVSMLLQFVSPHQHVSKHNTAESFIWNVGLHMYVKMKGDTLLYCVRYYSSVSAVYHLRQNIRKKYWLT